MGWVSGLIGQRTFRFWALAGVLVVSMAALAGGIAYGNTASCTNTASTLTDSAFEIDTNANLIRNNTGCLDWLNDAGTAYRTGVTVKNDSASGSLDESFGNGTKEDTAVPSIVNGGIPPNKSDLKAFGIYTEQGQVSTANPTGKYLALFWTRVQDPSGTTNMDFELNQSSTKSANGVTPVRTPGDLLLTYDLSNGGTVATISKRTWTASGWSAAQAISPARGSINTSLIPQNQAGGAPPTGLGSLDPRTFGEAIVPFNALFSQGTCGKFGSAYLKSRSSDSFTAALKDFVPPQAVSISNCPATLTTDATDSVTVGGSISDTATLDVPANTNGSIEFKLYGPFATAGEITSASCTAGKLVSGAGSTKPVANFNPANPTYTSNSYTTTAAGYYNWTAQFTSTTTGVNSTGEFGCGDTTEQSVVNKQQPAISTSATTPVTLGASIKDTATLTSATSNATGSITFKLYDSLADCNADTDVKFSDTNSNVNGNGNYDSASYTPTVAGTYYWLASYGGDGNNSAVSGACSDANEQSVVGKKQPTITTNATANVILGASIKDTATLANGSSPTGSITFKLYDSLADCNADTDVKFSDTNSNVNGNGNYDSASYTPSAVGTYYWLATYNGDDNNNIVSGECSDANEQSVVGKAAANVATAQKLFPQDSATLSASAGGLPTGTVDFALYGPNDTNCSGTAAYTEDNVTLTSGTANTNNTAFSVDQAKSGDYKWIVHYDGDPTHNEATSACGKEAFTATIDNDTTN